VEPWVDLKIIIPVYNTKEYIHECIQSILTQLTTYTYHVIIIDDGSTDELETVLKEYDSDSRITIVHQENKGAAGARNYGLRKLYGTYLMFVDSDDKLRPGAIHRLLHLALNKGADIVEGGYITYRKNKILGINKHKSEMCDNALGDLWGFVWAKVIRSELFKDMVFAEGYWFEDTNIAYLLYTRCNRVYTIENTVYGYRKNPKGFSHIKGRQLKLIDTYWIIEQIIVDMKTLGVEKNQLIYDQILYSIYISAQRTVCLSLRTQRYIFTLFADILNRDFNCYKTSDKNMKDFEKALRNSYYRKYLLFANLFNT
jgi:glycosyltransferase involved in cell wall biosynthesis